MYFIPFTLLNTVAASNRRLRNIAFSFADEYLLAYFDNLIYLGAIICIHDVFADRYTHYVLHNREEYALKTCARLYMAVIEVYNVGSQFLDLTNFEGTRDPHTTYRHIYVHDFLFARICPGKIILLKLLPRCTMSLLFVNSLRSTYIHVSIGWHEIKAQDMQMKN